MNRVDSIHFFHAKKPTIVTIGTFDGVHLGHKKILKLVTAAANELHGESLVLTFFPHPRTVLQADTEMKQLNTLAEKINLLESMGIDNLVIHPFDTAFSRLTAEEFVKQVLVETFQTKKIIIGYDHRFGRNRTANIDDLIQFGTKFGFEVEQISAKEINDVAISSTKIRNALTEGNVALANNYLGYDYSLTGTVVKGKQLGRTIDYPTANITVEEDYKLIPKNGVYIIKSTINGVTVFGMMNIGTRPTVDGTTPTIEVHYFDFSKDLYNQTITVALLEWMRQEQKFDTVKALQNQLDHDKKMALAYISKL
ncbi:bifunctional riboflavin kinase/FAD synthetase [Flavobacterium sp. j3]|uniref:Riboflavin biosynthesis protein n=1 Tax=Flavobacterium aureirubrum TaxID=3133147 RepID=A0ABU9N951_9FLAO